MTPSIVPHSATGTTEEPANDISLTELATMLLRHHRMIARWAVASSLVGIAFWAFTPVRFVASSSFMAEAQKTPGGLSNIAAQFGIALPTSQTGLSPLVYVDLLGSREILGKLVDTPVTIAGTPPVNLADAYEARGDTPALRRDATIKILQKRVAAAANPKTSVVSLDVSAPTAQLSAVINQRLIDLLSEFNMQTRQSQAGAERRFEETRVKDVRADLRAAEDKLQDFLEHNKGDLRGSPQEQLDHDRLVREVTFQQQLYTALAQAFEQAKIEEVRDTPVITVLQPPEVPLKRESRGSIKKVGLGFMVGIAIGVLLAFVGEMRRRTSGTGADEMALAQQWAVFTGDLRRPWRLMLSAGRP